MAQIYIDDITARKFAKRLQNEGLIWELERYQEFFQKINNPDDLVFGKFNHTEASKKELNGHVLAIEHALSMVESVFMKGRSFDVLPPEEGLEEKSFIVKRAKDHTFQGIDCVSDDYQGEEMKQSLCVISSVAWRLEQYSFDICPLYDALYKANDLSLIEERVLGKWNGLFDDFNLPLIKGISEDFASDNTYKGLVMDHLDELDNSLEAGYGLKGEFVIGVN